MSRPPIMTVANMTCCWFSRHPPLPAQSRALETHFPKHRFLWDAEVFADIDDIVDRIAAVKQTYPGAVEVVIVAPLSLIQKLIAKGIQPLYPVMREVVSGHPIAEKWFEKYGDSEVPRMVGQSAEYYRAHADSCVLAPRGRVLEFVKFRRLVGIHFEFEDLDNGKRKV